MALTPKLFSVEPHKMRQFWGARGVGVQSAHEWNFAPFVVNVICQFKDPVQHEDSDSNYN